MKKGKVIVDFKGLITNIGAFARPDGAVTTAENYVIESPGKMSPRRGFVVTAATGMQSHPRLMYTNSSLVSSGVQRFFAFVGNAAAETSAATKIVYGTRTGAWTLITWGSENAGATPGLGYYWALSTSNSVSAGRIVNISDSPTLYVYHLGPPMRICGANANPAGDAYCVPSGVPKALSPTLTATNGGAGFLTALYSVAYKLVYWRKTLDGVVVKGAPSSKVIMTAGAVTIDIILDVPIPKRPHCSSAVTTQSQLSTAHYVQVYRSNQASTVGGLHEDYKLVYERSITAAEITAGTLSITDSAPDEWRLQQPDLYTNPNSGDVSDVPPISDAVGEQWANDFSPVAYEACEFKNRLYLGNIRDRSYFEFEFVARPADGDTITLKWGSQTAIVFTADAVWDTDGDFEWYTGGTLSDDLRKTAAAFCYRWNTQTTYIGTSGYYAYPNYSDVHPGGVLMISRIGYTATDNTLTFTPSAPQKFRPYNSTSPYSVTSTFDTWTNGLWHSKENQPEHFPLDGNWRQRVGPNHCTILRLFKLRDVMFIFTDVGLYILTGDDESNFSINLFDESVILLGCETLAIVDDALYCLCTNGVARIDTNGVKYVSERIKDLINAYVVGADSWAVRIGCFAVGDNQNGNYYLWLASVERTTVFDSTYAYVYNTRSDTWVKHTSQSLTTAIVDPTDRRILAAQVTLHPHATDGNGPQVLPVFNLQESVSSPGYTDTGGCSRLLAFQVRMPEGLDAIHWQEVLVSYKSTGASQLDVTLTFVEDISATNTAATAQTPAQYGSVLRYLVPQSQRRAPRLSFSLSIPTGSYPVEIEGVEVTYSATTHRTVK